LLYRLKVWAEKTESQIDDFIIKGVQKSVIPLLYLGIFYAGITTLTMTPKVSRIIEIASLFLLTFFIIRFISSGILSSLKYFLKKQERGEEKVRQLRGMTVLINIMIWVIGLVFLMDNLGFDISAVIAGLGIGGIAIALAAQAILGDLFSYFVIFFDRPFEVGDFITAGDKSGTVEYTGIKTTRIRALSGEQLVFSNTDLTNSRIHNFKKLEKRRAIFKLGVVYQTPSEKLEEIISVVKQIIEKQPDTIFDRGHFASYGDFSLVFEFVYFVAKPEYVDYMDTQQRINLEIYKEFSKRKIEFAYPTQTLYLNKEDSSKAA
jgi:small-conductance mechanosensitive channel